MPETAPASQTTTPPRLIAGHLAQWRELLDVLAERHGLTVVVGEPLSGTSLLLAGAVADSGVPALYVDARRCADALDLAMAIADVAVAELAPEAQAWWLGTAPPASTAGLALARTLSAQGIDLDPLRRGEAGGNRLGEALELVTALTEREVTLAIDHLGTMLANLRTEPARQILGDLRAARQRSERLDLVLVDHPGGPVARALADAGHPLYRAGERLRLRRPRPDQLVADLAELRLAAAGEAELVHAAADLAAGVPGLTWAAIELAPAEGDARVRALAGWQALRKANATTVRRQWDLLRRLHPAATTIVAAISLGLKPHSLALASKTVDDALHRLRDVGLAWQPSERQWVAADPLLAAYARENAPAWALRRTGQARAATARW